MMSARVSSHSSSALIRTWPLPSFEIGHFRIGKARAEFLRLLVHVHDQLRTVDAFREAGEIFDQRGRGKLTARLAAFEHEWIQVRAGGINRRRQSRATAADNDHFFHRAET